MDGIFSASVYDSIIAAWDEDQNHPHRKRVQHSLPSPSLVMRLVDACYEASIQREEGRDVRFTIAVPDPEGTTETEKVDRRFELLSFKSAVPFSVQALRKLSLATDPKKSCLLVRETHDSHELEVFGLALLGNRDALRELPVGTRYSLVRPDWLTVVAESSGTIVVARGSSKIGLLTAGRFSPSTPTPFVSRAMGGILLATIKQDPGFCRHGIHYWHDLSRSLDSLIRAIADEHHGGTVILISPAHLPSIRDSIEFRYPTTGSLRLSDILIERLEINSSNATAQDVANRMPHLIALSDALAERVDATARLAAVDGAVILTTELNVVGFGATLKSTEDWSGKTAVGHDGFAPHGEPFEMKKLGTRHNSAVNFVGAHPGTFAFVVSSDGPIRGFTRVKDNVVAWPDFRASMFVE